MGDIATKGNRLTKRKGPHGHASQPHLSVHAKGGRAGKFGGGRTNLLEELGRVEAEPSNRNRRAEISRVHGELNRGYAKGGRAGYGAGAIVKGGVKAGKRFLDFIKTGKHVDKHGVKVNVPKAAERLTGKPHVDHGIRKKIKHLGKGKAEGGRIGLKEGLGIKRKERPSKKPKRGRELTGDDPIIKSLAGGVEGKPHSSKEGRYASAKRKFGRLIDDTKYDPNPFKAKKGGKADKKWIQKAVNPKHKGYCTPMTKKTCTPARKALARTFKKKAKTGWG